MVVLASALTDSVSFAPGTIVGGKYALKRKIAQGGMGTVLLATHILLDQLVAIKVLREDIDHSPHATERLLREARALARLHGPHVARVLDVDATEGAPPFLVMEYLQGEDLSSVLKRTGPMRVSVATDYMLQACEALAEAHASGIIHRDIKPSNLFLAQLPDGSHSVKVLDFGISKLMTEAVPITRSASVLGSPPYMAPEQMRSTRDVDARGDIWSLGVVLFEFLTRQVPYPGNCVFEVCAAILESKPVCPSSICSDIPAELDAVIIKCLQREREARFNSVVEFAQAIAPFSPKGAERLARIAEFRMPSVLSEFHFHEDNIESTVRADGVAQVPKRGSFRWIPSGLVSVALLAGLGIPWWSHCAKAEVVRIESAVAVAGPTALPSGRMVTPARLAGTAPVSDPSPSESLVQVPSAAPRVSSTAPPGGARGGGQIRAGAPSPVSWCRVCFLSVLRCSELCPSNPTGISRRRW